MRDKFLTFHVNESGDYTVLKVGSKQVYAGSCEFNLLSKAILEEIGIEYEVLHYPDNLYEELFS